MNGAMQAAAMGFTQGLAGGRVQTVPHEKGQVECELDILEKELVVLGDAITALDQRLTPALREINMVPSTESGQANSADGTVLISRRFSGP